MVGLLVLVLFSNNKNEGVGTIGFKGILKGHRHSFNACIHLTSFLFSLCLDTSRARGVQYLLKQPWLNYYEILPSIISTCWLWFSGTYKSNSPMSEDNCHVYHPHSNLPSSSTADVVGRKMRPRWQGYLHRHRYYTRCSNSPWTFHHLLKVKGE